MTTFFIFLSIYLWVFISIYVYFFIVDEDPNTWRKLALSFTAPIFYPILTTAMVLFFFVLYLFGQLDDDVTQLQ